MIQFSTARKRPVHTPCIVMVFASCRNEDGSLRNWHAEPDALGHMLRNTESRVNMVSKSLDKLKVQAWFVSDKFWYVFLVAV